MCSKTTAAQLALQADYNWIDEIWFTQALPMHQQGYLSMQDGWNVSEIRRYGPPQFKY